MSIRKNQDYYWGRACRTCGSERRVNYDGRAYGCNVGCMSHCNSCNCGCACRGPRGEKGEKGERGLQGPQGLQGPIGPTGPTVKTLGLQAQAKNSKNALIKDGANIILDTLIGDPIEGIKYDTTTGNATFSLSGNYAIVWWVLISGAVSLANVQIGIYSNPASPVEYITSMMPTTTGQICGQALLTVTQVPTTVALVNKSGNSIQLSNMDIQVDVMMVYLGGE